MSIVKPQPTTSKPVHDGPPPLEPDVHEPVKPKPSSEPKPVSQQPSQPQSQPQQQPVSHPPTTTEQKPQTQPINSQNKVRYEWYQTETHVTITIFIKNVDKEKAKINIQPTSLSVDIPEPTPYQSNIELLDKVNPEESTTNILGTKIEIKLKKLRPAKWPSLENTGGQVKSWDVVVDTKKEKGLLYPSSSKTGAKDWEALSKTQEDDKLDGDAALNKVFQDIYKGASDDQRRAMLKSFQESGGTVLSTNWDEVGKGEVKGHPPKGMDMKYWKDL